MFLTVHATTGILIGGYTGNIYLAFIAGLLSHVLLDILPHGDQIIIDSKPEEIFKDKFAFTNKDVSNLKKATAVDGLIMASLMVFFYFQGAITNFWPMLFAVGGAILPDFLVGIYFLTRHPMLKKIFAVHTDLHFILAKMKKNPYIGLFIQVLILLASIYIIIKF